MSSNEATRTVARRDAVARVLPRPGAQPERHLRGRAFALLWGAGTILVTGSLLAPGGESDEPEALTVGAVSLAYALALFLGAGRLPRWSFDVAVATGSGVVSVLVWRSGGAASSFAPLYIWQLAFAAAFLPLWRTALQCLIAGAGYVAAIDLADADAPTGRVVIVLATLLIVPGIAERLCTEIAHSTTSDGVGLTASFGVAQDGGSDLLTAADGALYRAKTAGRDRCELADSQPT